MQCMCLSRRANKLGARDIIGVIKGVNGWHRKEDQSHKLMTYQKKTIKPEIFIAIFIFNFLIFYGNVD